MNAVETIGTQTLPVKKTSAVANLIDQKNWYGVIRHIENHCGEKISERMELHIASALRAVETQTVNRILSAIEREQTK